MPMVESAGAKLFYDVVDVTPPWIDNPPSILFHHGVSTTRKLWSDWIPVLCDRYRLILFDTRGFGQSAPHPSDTNWSVETLVEDILAVADAAAVDRFHLVGESAGGTAAMATAIAHPARLLSLTVSNATHRGTAVRNIRGLWRERIEDRGQADWARQMMEWRFFPGSLDAGRERWFQDEQARCSADATLALAELLLRTDLSEAVRAIAVPTLVLSPDSSPFIPVEMALDLRDRIPGAELHVFAHSRHGLPLSHGKECAQVLRRFLERRFGP